MIHLLVSLLLATSPLQHSPASSSLTITNGTKEWIYQQGDYLRLTWTEENGIRSTSFKGILEDTRDDAIKVSDTWIPLAQITRISMPRRNQKPMTQAVDNWFTVLIFGLPVAAFGLFLIVLISAFGGPSSRFQELLANGGAIFSYLLFLFGPVLAILFHPGRKRRLGNRWKLRIK